MSVRLRTVLAFLAGSALVACIDAPEFVQVDTASNEPASTSAPVSTDAATSPPTSGGNDDDDDDDVPTPPSPPSPPTPGADAGALCGGKVCKADQMCCENKCKGGNKC